MTKTYELPNEKKIMVEIKDCHYCNWCVCSDANDERATCYAEDNGYFSHDITDSKKAETCSDFLYCDSFPKY